MKVETKRKSRAKPTELKRLMKIDHGERICVLAPNSDLIVIRKEFEKLYGKSNNAMSVLVRNCIKVFSETKNKDLMNYESFLSIVNNQGEI